jgi:uncharacterized ion transporter superfamily protein YfcC
MKKFPDTLLIIFGIMIVFIGLTWLVPAGEFERTVINGREVLVPGSYERVEANPQGLGALLQGPVRGFISAAQIIAFVFLMGCRALFNSVSGTRSTGTGYCRW